ncbi:MAG: hypothetical protein VX163_00945 [Pseudomonadota bacterium]|nr:hypothetical protein [Pseudomonadota bacterium]|tara:strand:- start:398 stop:895 length:498 start_codon:yes stop_codon:yes gene_type:complete
MDPNFHALQLIAEIALGILGFSAILIGLSRKSDGFSAPDNFRIQLLSYSSIGAMFCALIPFAVFGNIHNETSWLIVNWILCLYSVLGLFIFPKRVISLRIQGYSDLFPLPLFIIQMGVLAVNFLISGLMIIDFIEAKENFYVFCLMLFLIQGSIAFVRTIFYRAQ